MRVPLYVKILGWFLLNLAALFLGFWLVFRAQFPGALDALLLGPAGARINSAAELISSEMDSRRSEDWAGFLQRIGDAYQARFYLITRGRWFPAPPENMPDALREAVPSRPPPPGALPPGEGRPPMQGLPPPPPPPPPRSEYPKTLVRAGDRYWIIVNLPPIGPERSPRTLVIESMSLVGGGLFLDVTPWLAIGAAALGFSLLFWLPLVSSITRTISRLRDATRQVAEGKFDVRVPVGRRDELGALSVSINDMTARLEGLVNGQKRFLGDVAHELCSPLARMEVALAILEQRVEARDRASLADVQEELREMSRLAAELLSFSKASLDAKPPALESVPVLFIAEAAAKREKSVNVEFRIPATCRVLAQPGLLERALANLLRNARQHGSENGKIVVEARPEGSDLLLSVADSGAGVEDAVLPQIFDPFFRPDLARTREAGGTGLGLAIVKTCVEGCGGMVSAQNVPGAGLKVTMRLRAV